MSTETNKAVLRRWLEAWNQRDVNVMEKLADEIYTTDVACHDPSLGFGPDLEGVKQFARRSLKANPDGVVTVEDLIAEDDKVVARFTVRGTDASSGKPMHLLLITICRFAGGKIAEAWQLVAPSTDTAASNQGGALHDPTTVVKAMDAASNAGDLDGIMAHFAQDAVLKDPDDGKVHVGKEWIRAWFQPQMGHFHVESKNHQVTGSTVTWDATLTGDAIKQMGRESIKETAEAVVRDGKITSFAPTIVPRKA